MCFLLDCFLGFLLLSCCLLWRWLTFSPTLIPIIPTPGLHAAAVQLFSIFSFSILDGRMRMIPVHRHVYYLSKVASQTLHQGSFFNSLKHILCMKVGNTLHPCLKTPLYHPFKGQFPWIYNSSILVIFRPNFKNTLPPRSGFSSCYCDVNRKPKFHSFFVNCLFSLTACNTLFLLSPPTINLTVNQGWPFVANRI